VAGYCENTQIHCVEWNAVLYIRIGGILELLGFKGLIYSAVLQFFVMCKI
jgi:hypothetical protein